MLAQRCPCTSYDDLLCCCSKPTSAIICSDYMQQYLDITKSLYSMCSSSYRTPLSPKVLPTRGGAIFAALHLRQIAKHFLLTASRDNNRQTPSMSNTPPPVVSPLLAVALFRYTFYEFMRCCNPALLVNSRRGC